MNLPQTLGPYRLVELLGVGAFGSVYRAELDGALGFSQGVALKLLDPGRARKHPDMVANLVDEAALLSRIQHPNVVRVRGFEAIEHPFLGTTYVMPMELVRGISLRALMDSASARGILLPVRAALLLLSEAVEGLDHAHRLADRDGNPLGLVHRDMKPENVLVTNEGRLKILDFGIAYVAERRSVATESGITKGTVLYMSPEQLRGHELTGLSDLYSLGTVFFELISGRPWCDVDEETLSDLPGLLTAAALTQWGDREGTLREVLVDPGKHDLGPDEAGPIVHLLESMLRADPEDRADGASLLDQLECLDAAWRFRRGRSVVAELVGAEYVSYDGIPQVRDEHITDRYPSPDGDETVPAHPVRGLDRNPDWIATQQDETATRIVPVSGPRSSGSQAPARPLLLVLLIASAVVGSLAFAVWPQDPEPSAPLETAAADTFLPPLGAPGGPAEPVEPVEPVEPERSLPAAEAPEAPGPKPDVTPPVSVAEAAPPPARATPRAKPQPTVTDAPSTARSAGPAPRTARPKVRIAHEPPRSYMRGQPITLVATTKVSGQGDSCRPEVVVADSIGKRFHRHPMGKVGAVWSVTVPAVPTEPRRQTVRYFMECCWGEECPVRWKRKRDPWVLRPQD